MTVAAMQPYLFPYLGYFQLMHAADVFVLLDDVTFIKKGWINRNAISGKNGPQRFSMPVQAISQNKKIGAHTVGHEPFVDWSKKLQKTFAQNKLRTKGTQIFHQFVTEVMQKFEQQGDILGLTEVLHTGLTCVQEALHIECRCVLSSHLGTFSKGQQGIIERCLALGAERYVNPIGGKTLYQKETFLTSGVELQFLETIPSILQHIGNDSILSTIDKMEIPQTLSGYSLS